MEALTEFKDSVRHLIMLGASAPGLESLIRCDFEMADRLLNVHHRTYERRGYELPEDLTVLCVACHTAVHLVVDARAGKVRPLLRRVYE
jgi:hypothetical protein